MHQKTLSLLVSVLLLLNLSTSNSKAADTENFVGVWEIYDASNVLIDSIEITIVVSQNDIARFSYQQQSHSDTEQTSQQGILIDDLVVFDLIELGFTKTYAARIDFAANGGGGIEISTQLASCNVIGIDNTQVAKKNRERLTSGSARCDGSSFYESSTRNIKFVKAGTSASTINTGGDADQETLDNLETITNRLSGIWDITASKSETRRFVNKNISANFLGYQFVYRLIDPKIGLARLTQSDFLSANRIALLVDNYLIINPTTFGAANEVLVLKMQLKNRTGSGKSYKTHNGDCFPLKSPIAGTKVCTPSDESSVKVIDTKQLGSRRINKLNTKVTVNF